MRGSRLPPHWGESEPVSCVVSVVERTVGSTLSLWRNFQSNRSFKRAAVYSREQKAG